MHLSLLCCPVGQGGVAQGTEGVKDVTDKEWSREQVQLLVKAVTLHPAGTSQRYIGLH